MSHLKVKDEALQKIERRELLIKELIATEKSYVEMLEAAIFEFKRPLLMAIQQEAAIISTAEMDQIFLNVEEILEIHLRFVLNLETKLEMCGASTIGNFTICDVVDNFLSQPKLKSMYETYVNGFDDSISTITTLLITNITFNELHKKHQESRLHSLSSYLICPIQRIPRYVLLLKDIKSGIQKDHPDYKNTEDAFQSASKLATMINSRKRKHDIYKRMKEIADSVTDEDLKGIIANSDRVLIAEGMILELTKNGSTKKRNVLLFDDMIICLSANENKMRFLWKASFASVVLAHDQLKDGRKVFRMTRPVHLPIYPFIGDASVKLIPAIDPYDFGFWSESFDAAKRAFSKTKSRNSLAQQIEEITSIMKSKLMSEEDWGLLKTASSSVNETFNIDEVILPQGARNKYIFRVIKGSVRIVRRVGERDIQLGLYSNGDFFGELSYLAKNKGTKLAETSVLSDENGTVIQRIDVSKMDEMLNTDPSLALRFYKLLCYVIGNLFTQMPMTKAIKGELRIKSNSQNNSNFLENVSSPRNKLSKIIEIKETFSRDRGFIHRKADSAEDPSPVEQSSKEKEDYLSKKRTSVPNVNKNANIPKFKIPSEEQLIKEIPCKFLERRGRIYIFANYLCLYSKAFASSTKLAIPITSITKILSNENLISIYTKEKLVHNIKFDDQNNLKSSSIILKSIIKNDAIFDYSNGIEDSSGGNEILTKEGQFWTELLKYAHLRLYRNDETIIIENTHDKRLSQVVEGTCDVTISEELSQEQQDEEENGKNVVRTQKKVGVIEKDQVLGEISFLMGTVTCANVIAKGNVRVLYFVREELEEVFTKRPDLGAAFYKFLAQQLRQRFITVQRNAENVTAL